MTEITYAAIIALSGAIITSIIAAIVQIKITKNVTQNARDTVLLQVNSSNNLEKERNRKEHIANLMAQFISNIDPECNKRIIYVNVVDIINKIQLRLNRNNQKEKKN